MLSIALGLIGAIALLTGAVELGGAEGGDPTCRICGWVARLIGAVMLLAAIVVSFAVVEGLLVAAIAAVAGSLACQRGAD